MFQRSITILASLLFLIGFADRAIAQSMGRTSPTGTGGIGSTGLGSSGIGSGFGSSGIGASQFGSSSSLGGAGGFTTNNQFSVDSTASQGFVGRSSESVEPFFSATESGRQSFMQALGLQPRTDRPTTGQGRQLPPVRITLRVAFETPPIQPNMVGSGLKNQFSKSLKGRLMNPDVTVQDRTVILNGEVSSDYEKLLVEKLALLEPGVSRVENRVVVNSDHTN